MRGWILDDGGTDAVLGQQRISDNYVRVNIGMSTSLTVLFLAPLSRQYFWSDFAILMSSLVCGSEMIETDHRIRVNQLPQGYKKSTFHRSVLSVIFLTPPTLSHGSATRDVNCCIVSRATPIPFPASSIYNNRKDKLTSIRVSVPSLTIR
jgi:hypothetical protein